MSHLHAVTVIVIKCDGDGDGDEKMRSFMKKNFCDIDDVSTVSEKKTFTRQNMC